MLTFDDLKRHIMTYLAKDAGTGPDSARIALNAYRAIANKRDWSYYKRFLRLNTQPFQDAGTVQYTNSTLTMTLTGATWPTWAPLATLRINNVWYNIASVIDSTHVLMSESNNPAVDLPAGTYYALYQDMYPLPPDFRSLINMEWAAGTNCPAYIDPEEWSNLSTLVTGPAAPYYFTIYGDRRYYGLRQIRFYPAPDLLYAMNIIYNGAGRDLQIADVNTGTASIANNSVTVTGNGTAWNTNMIGSVFRFAGSAGDPPTGFDDVNPTVLERIIVGVAAANSLTLDQPSVMALTGVAYRISDPVDVAQGPMENYLFRECEKQARMLARSKATGQEEQDEYEMALREAMEADSVFAGTRVARLPRHRPRLLREYPINLSG
jgi:hypothetical protein